MSYLFIDSTYDLTLGVLDDGLNWLTLEQHKGLKASTVIQSRAYELLKAQGISTKDLKGIIAINGPGFYTGLRLAEGFSDVFHFFGVPQYSFYTYEIPQWCGFAKGTWFTKAYRGEYFAYHWDEAQASQELLAAKDLPNRLPLLGKIFIHSETSLDELCRGLMTETESTFELLKNNSKLIMKNVIASNLKREAFYFRAPEDEFKANP